MDCNRILSGAAFVFLSGFVNLLKPPVLMSSITRHHNCYQSDVIMICWRSYIVLAWWSNQATDPRPYLVLVDWRGNITSYVPGSISGERKPSWLALLIIFSRVVACQKPPAIVAFTLLFILCLSFNRVDKKSQSWSIYENIWAAVLLLLMLDQGQTGCYTDSLSQLEVLLECLGQCSYGFSASK